MIQRKARAAGRGDHRQKTRSIRSPVLETTALCLGSTIAIIVPEDSLRRSLCFLLEAEGHLVLPLAVANGALDQVGIDCIVIDEKAMPVDSGSLPHGLPVVMLVDRTEARSSDGRFRLVEKPILGTVLIEAVQGAICSSRCAERLAGAR